MANFWRENMWAGMIKIPAALFRAGGVVERSTINGVGGEEVA